MQLPIQNLLCNFIGPSFSFLPVGTAPFMVETSKRQRSFLFLLTFGANSHLIQNRLFNIDFRTKKILGEKKNFGGPPPPPPKKTPPPKKKKKPPSRGVFFFPEY